MAEEEEEYIFLLHIEKVWLHDGRKWYIRKYPEYGTKKKEPIVILIIDYNNRDTKWMVSNKAQRSHRYSGQVTVMMMIADLKQVVSKIKE